MHARNCTHPVRFGGVLPPGDHARLSGRPLHALVCPTKIGRNPVEVAEAPEEDLHGNTKSLDHRI